MTKTKIIYMKKIYKHATKSGISLTKLPHISNSQEKYIRMKLLKIAGTLQELRISFHLSQEELAELTSVSVSSIKAIEQNVRAPSLPMLLRILFIIDLKLKGKPRETII